MPAEAPEWVQYLAQAGYVVLEPKYRGSTGYGEVFRNLNVEDSNGGEVDDVAAGVHYLIDRGPVPPSLLNASRTGWTMIMRNLKDYLD